MLEMLQLSVLGLIQTIISLVAVAAGVVAGLLFVLFLIGAAVQVRWLRASERAGISAVA